MKLIWLLNPDVLGTCRRVLRSTVRILWDSMRCSCWWNIPKTTSLTLILLWEKQNFWRVLKTIGKSFSQFLRNANRWLSLLFWRLNWRNWNELVVKSQQQILAAVKLLVLSFLVYATWKIMKLFCEKYFSNHILRDFASLLTSTRGLFSR